MFEKRRRASAPRDSGLEQIDAYQRAIVDASMDHLAGTGYTDADLARERAEITALAGRIADALRAEYVSRQP